MAYMRFTTVGSALEDALDKLTKAQAATRALGDQAYKIRCLLDTLQMTSKDRGLLAEQLGALSTQAAQVRDLFYYQP